MDKTVYLVTGMFIALDLITGIIKAFKNRSFTSSIMRQGLFHKMGFILCIVFGCLVDYCQQYVDIGATVPVTKAILIYVILSEIGSIIENIGQINENIIPSYLKSMFKALNERSAD